MSSASLRSLFLKNASANVVGGAGAALFNLLLPALVVRHLGKLEFSVWSLALQVLIYLQLFGFGLQTAITRYVAHGRELDDLEDQRHTIKAALVVGAGFVALGIAAVALLVAFYPRLFAGIPPEMIGQFRVCVALLGFSAAIQLYALVPVGLFTGLQRNIFPVAAQLLTRMLSLLALWLVLQSGAGLLALSVTLAVCGALQVPVQFWTVRKWASELLTRLGPLNRTRFHEILHYCGGLAVWNVAMLLVNGVAVMLVGFFDFQRVGAYSLAATVITIMIGIQQAVMSPLLATGAKLNAREETRSRLPALLNQSTRICVVGLCISLFAIHFLGRELLVAWLGNAYSPEILSLLTVLAVANAIRNTALPYSLLLLAINCQKQVQVTVMVEGVITLVASLVLAQSHGAMGVAYGALIGATGAVACNYAINFRKTKILTPDIFSFSMKSLLMFLPLAGIFVLMRNV
jgi:O-antigen/teichoic acid export membrane protein